MEKTIDYLNWTIKEYPAYPNSTIIWLIPSPAGGDYDARARALAPLVQEFLPRKADIVIQNVDYPEEALAKALGAVPDGYTWLSMTFPGHVTSQILGKTSHDLRKFGWLGRMSREHRILSVSKKSPFRNLKDLQKAPLVRWPEIGIGSSDFIHDILQTHIMEINYSPILGYKGAPARVKAAVNGEADVISSAYVTQEKWFKSGELIPIVQHLKMRDPRLPQVPTSVELGYPETTDLLVLDILVALPPGVPRGVEEIIKTAFYRAIWDKRYFEWLVNSQRSYSPLSPWETGAALENQLNIVDKYKSVIKRVIDTNVR